MSNWFSRNFGSPGDAVADIRHELLGGWFGRNFEPHPTRKQAHDSDQEREPREQPAPEHGIDR